MSRLVVITNGNYFARVILEDLFEKRVDLISGVVIVSGDYHGRTGLKALWGTGSKTDLRYMYHKVVQYACFKSLDLLQNKACFSVRCLTRKYGIPTLQVSQVNKNAVVRLIEDLGPDLIVSVSCPQKIHQKLLDLATLGGINIHSSLLPTYAGLAPYYWVLSQNERETGTSVHYMTQVFDEGNILAQETVEIEEGMSTFKLFLKLAKVGSKALLRAVDLALAQDPGMPQDLSNRSYHSLPTSESYKELRRNGFRLMRLTELFSVVASEVQDA